MKAFVVRSFDTPPQIEDLPVPAPGPGEVRLRITACGLNFADLLMIKGKYQDTPVLPFSPGMEVCGTVVAHGPDVTEPAIGTRVAVFGGSGGLAEEACFLAGLCRPVPPEMPDSVAAGFQVAYGTSHLALTHRGRLRPGETLLVLGAAGGVGLTAVEIGKELGARVIAVARGADKLAVARAAGADHLIDASADIKAEVRALGGADVIYDPVGGDLFHAALRAANREARIITIGYASGNIPQIPANLLLVKNLDVIGFYWSGYLKFRPDVLTQSLSDLMDLYAQGRLRPHISDSFPLEKTADALAFLEARKSTGKVVVTMG